MCHNTYEKEITDEEAMQETQQYFPGTKQEECGVVCDDCWQLIKPLKTSDQFEQHLNDWLRSVHLDTVAEREQRNIDTFIKTLVEQGHSVRIFNYGYHLDIDEKIVVNRDCARKVPTKQLITWIDEALERSQQWEYKDSHP